MSRDGMPSADDSQYWVAFGYVKGIGPARLRRLVAAFGGIGAAWNAPESRLAEVLDGGSRRSLIEARAVLDLDAAMSRFRRSGARLVTWQSPDYPELLRTIASAPFALYVRGDVGLLAAPSVAIVGTRRATPYGLRVARRLACDLADAGLAIVSGLASGIDTAAHEAALGSIGRTLAVLGNGIDIAYPSTNRSLADRIADSGALVTEFPPGTPPVPGNFPARNRILSGLALATVVVEAGDRSGALITARLAAEQSREVLAVPGSVLSWTSSGTNELIATGAGVARTAADVLGALGSAAPDLALSPPPPKPTDAAQAALLDLLAGEPRHVDDLCRVSGLPSSEVIRSLAVMELRGMVLHLGHMKWASVR